MTPSRASASSAPLVEGMAAGLFKLTIDENERPHIPKLALSDLDMDEQIGSGVFSAVFKVKRVKGSSEMMALKRLNQRTLDSKVERAVAERDLHFEALILAKLPRHGNIIELRAISDDFWDSHSFIIVEHMSETLEARLERWRAGIKWYSRPNARLQAHRLATVALPVAEALQHCHHHGICYRDIKPANIGFDKDGTVKLFDFGLSRQHSVEDNRQLTGCTGTSRYMAPEVMRCDHYSFPADIYSFAILTWEIAVVRTKPFGKAPSVEKMARLLRQNVRPALRPIADQSVARLLADSWHPDPHRRPSMALVAHELQELTIKPTSVAETDMSSSC